MILLAAACDQIKGAALMDWDELIIIGEWAARDEVRDQLSAAGWPTPRRVLGIIPAYRVGLYDVDLVRGLADQVAEALRNAIDGRPAEPRLLAVGLLGVLGQMPTILSFKECAQHRQRLREMTLATTPPILALHKAIQTYHVRCGGGCSPS
jgi:Golgi phosphoprotein 3 (GPP34)